jgi:hypothetical protein
MGCGRISAVQEVHRGSQQQEQKTPHNNLIGGNQQQPGEGTERRGEKTKTRRAERKRRRGRRGIADANRSRSEENSTRDCAGAGEWGRCSEQRGTGGIEPSKDGRYMSKQGQIR